MFWKKNKQWIIVFGFLLGVGCIFYFGVRKIYDHIAFQKSKILEIESKQKRDRDRISQLSKLRSDYEFVMENELKVPIFLDKGRVVDFFTEIESLAEITGTQIEKSVVDPPDFLPGKGKNAPKEGETIGGSLPSKEVIQLRIKATGPFSGVMKLFDKLENERYLLDIISFELRSVANNQTASSRQIPGTPNTGTETPMIEEEVTANLNVVVYIQS